ncbi:2-methylaconitate cis-trans isomerase PrpF [Aliagarivorans taiwanensis]|uniref:2-methylaconitate cis-trans isomerase PrpF n=1 Tax=Aliagarivorans taiwanensis TaxID=561966 RepID=UPI00042975BB|nr:2-methylaconitate cis-trans isomerase PrpF [Aliagarivorans taiwanensis]
MTKQLRIPATYMRGGTSKGVFFSLDDLPLVARQPGPERDALLLRVIGSPDPYGKHIDGMGGGSSSTSKVVLVSKSDRPGHDVDYLFGQVAIDRPFVDWTGNCGNLSAAVGAFAIRRGLIDKQQLPDNGHSRVRIWQCNIEKTIEAQIPICDGEVEEAGDFYLDGVAFAAAEIEVSFVDPVDGALLPTGRVVDDLSVPELGSFNVSYINAGIPTLFLNASELGLSGCESQAEVNSQPALLEKLEQIRAHGALAMGLIDDLSQAKARQHTPKIAWVAPATSYQSSSGREIAKQDIDLVVRAMSMGQLHHAMMGTAAVAIASAAAVPGTLVSRAAGGTSKTRLCFGHPSGTLTVGAKASEQDGQWQIDKVVMSRSARVLMDGWVHIPSLSPAF